MFIPYLSKSCKFSSIHKLFSCNIVNMNPFETNLQVFARIPTLIYQLRLRCTSTALSYYSPAADSINYIYYNLHLLSSSSPSLLPFSYLESVLPSRSFAHRDQPLIALCSYILFPSFSNYPGLYQHPSYTVLLIHHTQVITDTPLYVVPPNQLLSI